MADSFLLKSFKLHFGAYIDKEKKSYKKYVYELFGKETMEWWAVNTFRGSGCDWMRFKENIINKMTPPNRNPDSASMVGLMVSSYIWWYVNRFGLVKDKNEIKKWVDYLFEKKIIDDFAYWLNDKDLFNTFDDNVKLFCSNDIIMIINEMTTPKRKSAEVSPQRGIGSVKRTIKRRK